MIYKILPVTFYEADVVHVARQLLGKVLVHSSPAGTTAGMIVETEAYSSREDPACHAFSGKTKRNQVMYGPAGRAYVYFIYGNHFCFNVVTNQPGIAEAALIRALVPLEGIKLMQERRGKNKQLQDLTSGPGKLCAAMGIGRTENCLPVVAPPLFLARGQTYHDQEIGVSGRIGIKQGRDKQWRFFVRDNPFVSRYR